MDTPAIEKEIYQFFRASVLIKGAVSLLEIIAGVLVLFVSPQYVMSLVVTLTRSDLVQDPDDFVATQLLHLAQQFTLTGSAFISFYLLSRGIIKLALVIGLLKNKLWAYPSSLIVLGLFIIYQCYQIATEHSGVIIALTLFDLVVMYFIWKEWRVVEAHRRAR